MQTIWLSPTDYVTGDPTLQISYPFVSHPSTVVTCTEPGDYKWVSMGLRLTPGAEIGQVIICYEVSSPGSFISQVRLTDMSTPNQANVIHDDPTDLKSTQASCYTSQVGGKLPALGAAVTLELRLNFQDTKDEIQLGAVGVQVDTTVEHCVNSIADLRMLGAGFVPCLTVLGYYAPGDGGGGVFSWSTTSGTDDGGTVIVPVAVGGGKPGTVGLCWERLYSGPLNVRWFGASPNNSDNQTYIAWAIAALGASGGTVYFPPGIYGCTSPIICDGLLRVRLVGPGRPAGTDAGGSATLQFTGTEGPFLSAKATAGFGLVGLTISYTSPSFTGTLLSLDGDSTRDTSGALIEDCLFTSAGIYTATLGISLDRIEASNIRNCNFGGLGIGIQGPTDDSSGFSNQIKIEGCMFPLGAIVTACINNPGSSWVIEACTFEPPSGGSCAGIACALSAIAITVQGCWFGDVTGSDSGNWIECNGAGWLITGNTISGAGTSQATGVKIDSSSSGVVIEGNAFESLQSGVSIGSNVTELILKANAFSTVTVPISGAPTTGEIQTGQVFHNFRARAYYSGAVQQTIPSNIWTQVVLDIANNLPYGYDPNSNFDTSTYSYSAPVAGYYQVNAAVEVAVCTAGSFVESCLVVGGQQYARGTLAAQAAGCACCSGVADTVYLSANQTLALHVLQSGSEPFITYLAFMSVHYLSS